MSGLPAFAELIRDHRISRRLTQEQVAKHAGISRAQYTNIETARLSPSLVVMVRLAAFFRISGGKVHSALRRDVLPPKGEAHD